MAKRDDFTEKTKLQIAKAAGWLCSYPNCRAPTVGATSDGKGVINVGTAAHICAAAPGGPRFDANMSPDTRRSANNGIWMCRDHGKAIDSDDPQFTVELLHAWKKEAQHESWRRVLQNEALPSPFFASNDELFIRFQAAAKADLVAFQRTSKWPPTSVALTLRVDGQDTPATTEVLASAVTSLDDLILVASPGMGKTTTLFQIASGVLERGNGIPIVVPLGDWATENRSILESLLRRPSFHQLTEIDFHAAATNVSVVLLLDGWNELDTTSRERARAEIEALKANFPGLNLLISTRKLASGQRHHSSLSQSSGVPFSGRHVEILPLDTEQQMDVARALRGEVGAKLVDQAWRTAGVRELVAIPLYLSALLSLPEGAPFPTTKEEVLRHFVSAHERDARRIEALRAATRGFQQDYLDRLAAFAQHTSSTAITDRNARRLISEVADHLIGSGQLAAKPEPDDVLNALVNNHLLTRTGDTPGVSFQHQQFQEWYASHEVEKRVIEGIEDPASRNALKTEIFNLMAWEEAILFSVERMARGDNAQKNACGKAILAAFEVDTMLAAEMIFRATEDVWSHVSKDILDLVDRWHTSAKSNRTLRFMLTSGRPEFLRYVWPLITHEHDQVSLPAIRGVNQFRVSILGENPEKDISALSPSARRLLLGEIAFNTDMTGLDLVTAIARNDPDPNVQSSIVGALAFRQAWRHVAEILKTASDATIDLVARRDTVDQMVDNEIADRLAAARARQIKDNATSIHARLFAAIHADEAQKDEIVALVSEAEVKDSRDDILRLVYELHNRHPQAVAEGILARLRAERSLFYRAVDILASAGFRFEDEALLACALAETDRQDYRAEAAAAVLGPQAVGQMIAALLEVSQRLRDSDGRHNQAASERYQLLQDRIAHVPGTSLVAAVQERSAQARNEEMEILAEILSRHSGDNSGRTRSFDADDLTAMQALAEEWGNRMLTSGNANRWQMARIAALISRAPSTTLLPLLKRMLDDNLTRLRAYRAEAAATRWQGEAANEARQPMTHEYFWAFRAIDAPETAALMEEYLPDTDCGELAAQVLATQWRNANEADKGMRFHGRVDFSRVAEMRTSRATNPDATCREAETIFRVIDSLLNEQASDEKMKLAVSLGIVALRLPHGQRDVTIEKLVEVASRETRPALLLSLVLSGEVIDVNLVATGLADTLEAAKTQTWILTQGDGYQLRDWLRLLPFVNRPHDIPAIVQSLPAAQRTPQFLEEMLYGLAESPSEGIEDVLFKLAEYNPLLCSGSSWQASVARLDTASAATRLIDLVAHSAVDEKFFGSWHLTRELGVLMERFPETRKYVYMLLNEGPTSPGLSILAQAVSENPDTEGLLLLLNFETEEKSHLGWRAIEKVVTMHVPVEGWKDTYDIVPIPASELRQRLLAMTTDGGPQDFAARCLAYIDKIRDECGVPESEPRHPDLASGTPWPIIPPAKAIGGAA
ncbi:hypothetical protein [Parvibaculum sp.]|uniref:NACHT domain-containing protein n=2 Tax=Parvibaculum sp. TaxID=2024848 RepID=UPI0025E5ED4E|nr:hypothetical protein [Parvibaculum sp.]